MVPSTSMPSNFGSVLVMSLLILHSHCGLNANVLIAWSMYIENACNEPFVVTLKFGFLGQFSRDPSQMETYFVKVLHLCQPQMPIMNSQTQVCQTDLKEEARLFVSHLLKYLLLRVTCHFQGLYSLLM